MRTIVLAGLVYFTVLCTALGAQPPSEPLLDGKDARITEHISDAQREGDITSSEAARLHLRRSSILGEARMLRQRNRGVLPTGDLKRLGDALDRLDQIVLRRAHNQAI